MVSYIKHEGKTYPIKFSQSAMMWALNDEGITNAEMANMQHVSKWPVLRFYRYVFYSLKYGAKKEEKEFDLTLEDVVEMVENYPDTSKEIMALYTASLPQGKESDKKKAKQE